MTRPEVSAPQCRAAPPRVGLGHQSQAGQGASAMLGQAYTINKGQMPPTGYSIMTGRLETACCDDREDEAQRGHPPEIPLSPHAPFTTRPRRSLSSLPNSETAS